MQTVEDTFLTPEKLWTHGSLTADATLDFPKGYDIEDDVR